MFVIWVMVGLIVGLCCWMCSYCLRICRCVVGVVVFSSCCCNCWVVLLNRFFRLMFCVSSVC